MTGPNERGLVSGATPTFTYPRDTTVVGSPVSLQADLDVLDTMNAASLVFEGFTIGYHSDLEAVATMGRAVQRKAHHALVARINRGL